MMQSMPFWSSPEPVSIPTLSRHNTHTCSNFPALKSLNSSRNWSTSDQTPYATPAIPVSTLHFGSSPLQSSRNVNLMNTYSVSRPEDQHDRGCGEGNFSGLEAFRRTREGENEHEDTSATLQSNDGPGGKDNIMTTPEKTAPFFQHSSYDQGGPHTAPSTFFSSNGTSSSASRLSFPTSTAAPARPVIASSPLSNLITSGNANEENNFNFKFGRNPSSEFGGAGYCERRVKASVFQERARQSSSAAQLASYTSSARGTRKRLFLESLRLRGREKRDAEMLERGADQVLRLDYLRERREWERRMNQTISDVDVDLDIDVDADDNNYSNTNNENDINDSTRSASGGRYEDGEDEDGISPTEDQEIEALLSYLDPQNQSQLGQSLHTYGSVPTNTNMDGHFIDREPPHQNSQYENRTGSRDDEDTMQGATVGYRDEYDDDGSDGYDEAFMEVLSQEQHQYQYQHQHQYEHQYEHQQRRWQNSNTSGATAIVSSTEFGQGGREDEEVVVEMDMS